MKFVVRSKTLEFKTRRVAGEDTKMFDDVDGDADQKQEL